MSILELKSISKSYGSESSKTTVLSELNFKIEPEKVVCIVGPSGSGKTTFLQIAGLLDLPTSGQVFFEGKDCTKLSDDKITKIRGRDIGFIYQFHNLIPELSAVENIVLPLAIQNKDRVKAYTQAISLMNELGIGAKAESMPNELSGGEQQRVAIARALITKPKLILADEPTGNLDFANANKAIDLILQEIRLRKIATIIVTHNMDIAKKADVIYTVEQLQAGLSKNVTPSNPMPNAALSLQHLMD